MTPLARIVLLLAALCVLAPSSSAGPADEVAAAEALVRATYFEGLPFARARTLTPLGVGRLLEMLRDPAERQWHDNVVAALGMSEDAQAFPALRAFAARAPEGEVDRQTYRALMALPFALGHLARTDARALAALEAALADEAAPRWRYKYLSGTRLRDQLRTSCVTALGIAGRVETLRSMQQTPATPGDARTQRRARHLLEARELAESVARDGPERAFSRSGQGPGPR